MRVGAAVALLAAALATVSIAGTGGWDHQSHAKPGEAQTVYENPPSSGGAMVKLDGSSSHSHYFNEGPPVVSGKIVTFVWKDIESGKTLAKGMTPKHRFPLETTKVELTVKDQTGDSSSATTSVTVVPTDRFLPGAFVYFYREATTSQSASSMPKPYFTQWRRNVAIHSKNDLPAEFRAVTKGAMRVMSQFTPQRTGKYQFVFQYMGGDLRVFMNDKLVAKGGSGKESEEKQLRFEHRTHEGTPLRFDILLTRRFIPIRMVFLNNAMVTATESATPLDVTHLLRLRFEPRRVVPVAMYASHSSGPIEGGQQFYIRASGLDGAGNISVTFACDDGTSRNLETIRIDASKHSVYGLTPEFPKACEGSVRIKTRRKGDSNRLPFRVSDGFGSRAHGPQVPVKFRKTSIRGKNGKPFKISTPTNIAFGPDGRYYIGTLTGVVYILDVDSRSLKVRSSCKSPRVTKKGSILGLAFNPLDKYSRNSATLYMSVSVLYHKVKKTGYRWDNGEIIAWKSVDDKRCMIFDNIVISGLPVSDQDHGVNALTFDNGGRLYISVGSNTNAGVRSEQFGDIPESQLSASVLVAEVSKRSLNSKIKYNQYKDIGTAKKTSGPVSFFATGIRNCFGLAYHSQFGLYATDNGMNQGFGETSTDCKKSVLTKNTQPDKLLRVKKGEFYGFPNRARKQCKFVAGKGSLTDLVPSTTGIAEYTANTFDGRLRGQLFLTRFAVRGSGFTSRVSLSPDGNKVSGQPIKVADMSGLAIAIGARGDLVMPQVQQGVIRVLQPIEKGVGGPDVLSVRPRAGPQSGGNMVSIHGSGFGAAVSVEFGGKKCNVVETAKDGATVKCIVPPGAKGGVRVVVTVNGKKSNPYGDDYMYG